jgi:DNA polymerase
MVLHTLSFDDWRDLARPLLIAGVEPEAAAAAIAEAGATAQGHVFADAGAIAGAGEPRSAARAPAPRSPAVRALKLPAALMRLLDSVSCFRAAGRYELMYRLAWRTLFESPALLEDAADPDVRNATLMDAAICRDVHKMHAFVRFREVMDAQGEAAYFAWFEPEHQILRRGSAFFVQRFANMTWTIATPDGAAVWNTVGLSFVASPGPEARPRRDGQEDLWRTYYRSICNVARINPEVMQREMPQKYWKNLPEAAEIGLLVRHGLSNFAGRRQQADERGSLMTKGVRRALGALPAPGEGPQDCRRCDLWQHATQAVVGEGARDARIVLVGEQPGDEEDLRGHPFVGPAGRVLDEAMTEAGLIRSEVYITNAVKHFKWEPRGRRRLHKKPDAREISACNVWLAGEISEISPPVIVALGATALRALVGSTLSIDAARRQELSHASGAAIVATYHPSAILRAEGERAADLRATLIADLVRARTLAAASRG